MNTNAVSIRSHGAEYTGDLPRVNDQSARYPVSVTIARMSADFLLLLAGTMIGGMAGHVLQLTTTFALTPQQLFTGSLLYSALVLFLLVGDNAYPRVRSLLSMKETEIALGVSIKAIVVCLVLSIVARYPVPRMATLGAWIIGTLYLTLGRGWVQEAIGKRFALSFPKRRTIIYGT